MSASDENLIAKLGPLAALAGIWEGDQGIDVSPGKEGAVETAYRERIVFEPMGPVKNGVQKLYGLDITIHDDGSFSYFEDTQLQVHGFEALFHHTDKNRLTKVSDS